MRRWPVLSALLLVAACVGRDRAPAPPEASEGRPAGAAAAGAAAQEDAPPPEAPSPQGAPADAVETASAEAPAAAPTPVPRSGNEWPFHPWDRAEAVIFNQFPMRPGVPLYAYDQRGFSPHLAERKGLPAALAKKAVALAGETRGEVEVSKCPFPRHAVVLYAGEVPVASINVCFECGDILLWPRWEAPPDWERMSPRELEAFERAQADKLQRYDATFPRWQAFFRDEVGFPIEAAPR